MRQFHRQFSAAPKRRQTGQALVWLLGTLAASAAVLYGVYNVGQLHTAKAKTVNAADAAALAGATVQARMLNLIAYNNRSIIANEVLLVQMLSMESWLGYVRKTADNIATVLKIAGVFAPPLEAVGQFLATTSQAVDRGRAAIRSEAVPTATILLNGSNRLFAANHNLINKFGGLAAEDAATKIVQANKVNFGERSDAGLEMDSRAPVRALTFGLNQRRWLRFSRQRQGNDRADTKQVLLDSRDDFSANRPGQPWLNLNFLLAGSEKKGGTTLVDYERWESQDTLETWEQTLKGKVYQPIGWGRNNAAKQVDGGNAWSPNRTAQKLAYQDGLSNGNSHANWGGVPAVFDVADKTQANRANLGVDFLVAVRRPQRNAPTSSNLGMGAAVNSPAGQVDMPERLQGEQLSALAKARVSFERPQRNSADISAGNLMRRDNAKEYGSLFSPYWQARLVDLTVAEKAGLMTAMGANPAAALLTPGGQN